MSFLLWRKQPVNAEEESELSLTRVELGNRRLARLVV